MSKMCNVVIVVLVIILFKGNVNLQLVVIHLT